MGHSVADAAAGLAVLVQDAPDRVRQEWDLFQEEVKAEAERLDCESGERSVDAESSPASSVGEESLQTKIDQLRSRVADLGMRMEERS
jgi:FPC/CPF motif-containing protein YcgG